MAKLTTTKVNLDLLLGNIEGNWTADENEQNAAWELYVELITRIPTAGMQPEGISLREALTSLHRIYNIIRDILRKYGPLVAQPKGYDDVSFGHLALAVLNLAIRPVLEKWNHLLLEYECTRGETASPFEHERKWKRTEELKDVIDNVNGILIEYSEVLAKIAGVPSLITQRS